MIESIEDPEKRLSASAMYCMQYNLGGRIDDVSKAQKFNLSQNKDIAHQDLSVITKLPWSKNVTTKKQALWQILIGAANSYYCVLLGIAVWLEFMIMYGRYNGSDFLFAYRGSNDEASIRREASDILKSVLTDDEFEVLLDESEGTHLMRKFASDMAKKGGSTRMILILVSMDAKTNAK